MMHDPNHFRVAGRPLEEAEKVMVLVHGRGSTSQDILLLADHIQDKTFAFIAPQAYSNTWYPYSFLRPTEENEPYLSSALAVLLSLRARLQADFNFKLPQIYWMGFSQGACLLLEFIARNASQYGGVFGLSGGLIGPEKTSREYDGSFGDMPLFLGCSDRDTHVPKERVLESERVFQQMGAQVTTKLYPNFPHSINQDELNIVNLLLTGAN